MDGHGFANDFFLRPLVEFYDGISPSAGRILYSPDARIQTLHLSPAFASNKLLKKNTFVYSRPHSRGLSPLSLPPTFLPFLFIFSIFLLLLFTFTFYDEHPSRVVAHRRVLQCTIGGLNRHPFLIRKNILSLSLPHLFASF